MTESKPSTSGFSGARHSSEDKWVDIQQSTFTNWVNEQLSQFSGRTIEHIASDLCDGVNLVALVESLQFKKLGKVYTKPTSRIQMLQNVSLAFTAITDDNIKLVNIGSEDIVNGNHKLILGLIWHLIVRYQISSRKSKSPPKKLMLNWFQMNLPSLEIKNFTGDWNDGIALSALVEHLKPGTIPDWSKLHSKNRLENCRNAMILAKEKLNIPRVLSPEHFSSSDLDELSAMTYLSYFVKVESPGYYNTLNWVCKQLRTTIITNLTTDWNDGYNMCAIVKSLGGEIPGWPDVDREDRVGNCQKALDGARSLGVEPLLSASEMADPKIDHLSMMTYLTRFQHVAPKKSDDEKFRIATEIKNIRTGVQSSFRLTSTESKFEKDKLKVEVTGPKSKIDVDLNWSEKFVECRFTVKEAGTHNINAFYNGTLLAGCPVAFVAKADLSKVKLLTRSAECQVGTRNEIEVAVEKSITGFVSMEIHSPNGEVRVIPVEDGDGGISKGIFQPKSVGVWSVRVNFEGEEVGQSPIQFDVYDPKKIWLSTQARGIVGEEVLCSVNTSEAGSGEVTAEVRHVSKQIDCSVIADDSDDTVYNIVFIPVDPGSYLIYAKFHDCEVTGSPKRVDIVDPGQIIVIGEGISRGLCNKDCKFQVNTGDLGGNINVSITINDTQVETSWRELGSSSYEFCYKPSETGVYVINVMWNDRHAPGSPFSAKITDRNRVKLINDLTDLKDENDYLALECDTETKLTFDISSAGPGSFNAEVLSPSGKLKVDLQEDNEDEVALSFKAKEEGDHYIHLYWSDVPLDSSPILAYCPGPILPVDHTKVIISGNGCCEARAMVPAEFRIDGRKAGPGIPRVVLKGVKHNPTVDMKALKYDRYICNYKAPTPGGYLLYVYWSDEKVPGIPYKISVSTRGAGRKVKVTGFGLKGGFVGQELRVVVNTKDAGYGEVDADFKGRLAAARCDILDQQNGIYTLRLFPTEACRHQLGVKYDKEDVPGSPFNIPVGEPPDPRKVQVYGPGIEDGMIQKFESKFIVETYGAGAGQLAIRIRGPRGAFNVDMERERENDRTILCHYDPTEPGEYFISVRWSGHHVRGSPFKVNIHEIPTEFKKNGMAANFDGIQWTEDV